MTEEQVGPVPFWLCERMTSLHRACEAFERRLGLPAFASRSVFAAESRVALHTCRWLAPERRFELRPHGVAMILQ